MQYRVYPRPDQKAEARKRERRGTNQLQETQDLLPIGATTRPGRTLFTTTGAVGVTQKKKRRRGVACVAMRVYVRHVQLNSNNDFKQKIEGSYFFIAPNMTYI